MSDTGYAAFSTTVAKTNQILSYIENTYHWDSQHRELSYHALRAVLHALRDRLTVQEANDLAAPLPMLVRGLFYEGWKPAAVPVKMDREAFMQRVAQEFVYDLPDSYENLVQTVVVALSQHIPEGELNDLRAMLPKDIADILP